MQKSVLCFGEVLWDNFTSGREVGGAPFNVAYHLAKAGINSTMISAIGKDENGAALNEEMNSRGVNLSCLQEVTAPTGEVKVLLDENGSAMYDIVFPAAWDFISADSRVLELAKKADALVFGTLAARNKQSRETLLALIEQCSYNVLDVNLRAPHFSKELVLHLASKAQLLKINDEEFSMLAGWLGVEITDEYTAALEIIQQLMIEDIIVTKGSVGACLFNLTENIFVNPPKTIVADTVGSGDAFLAGFISKRLNGSVNKEALRYATALASLVTGMKGACPDYEPEKVRVEF